MPCVYIFLVPEMWRATLWWISGLPNWKVITAAVYILYNIIANDRRPLLCISWQPNDHVSPASTCLEMFIFPDRQLSSPSTTTTTTVADELTPLSTTPETAVTKTTTTTTTETAVTEKAVTSSDRKIIINLKDIYHCPATGKQTNKQTNNQTNKQQTRHQNTQILQIEKLQWTNIQEKVGHVFLHIFWPWFWRIRQ